MKFNKDFIFGVATASYQIEGGVRDGNRALSIWDTFSHTSGKIKNGENGDVACDHYHRWKEDVSLMKELGVDAYRLSIAWPRIFTAQGQYNPEGMEFYKRLLTELKAKNIKTAVTLYHWDLPQWAEDKGGWKNREICDWYVEYAKKCFEELDDLVDMWITHNEPWCQAFLGYYEGNHAPGEKSAYAGVRAAHHILLSHGMAVKEYRKFGGKKSIGITLNLYPVYADTKNFGDRVAADLNDDYQNNWFLDPLFKKSYPTRLCAAFGNKIPDYDFIREGDFDIISAPMDFLGVNFYSHNRVRYDVSKRLLNSNATTAYKKTNMNWDITPHAFYDLLYHVRTITDLPIYITENGSAWPDVLEGNEIHDKDRVDYLLAHLAEIERANEQNLNIRGYFAWSFMDNFEWSHGYSQRFGLVYVDYETQERYPKDSFYAYQKVIAEKNAQ